MISALDGRHRHRSMVSAGRPGFGFARGGAAARGGGFPSSRSPASSSSSSSMSSASVATAWNPALAAARLPVGRMDRGVRGTFRPVGEAAVAPPCRFPCTNIAALAERQTRAQSVFGGDRERGAWPIGRHTYTSEHHAKAEAKDDARCIVVLPRRFRLCVVAGYSSGLGPRRRAHRSI